MTTYIPAALRQQVGERAALRCEYCRLHQDNAFFTHEVDHVYAEKHGGETLLPNLSLACADCNRHKGSDLCSLDAETGEIVALYHPRRDGWDEHFRMHASGIIDAVSGHGRVTLRVLDINDKERVTERARLLALGVF
jgi:hypothetical protein